MNYFVFTGYVLEVNGDLQQQVFKTKEQAKQVCQQNNLPESCIIQIYRQRTIA